MTIELSTAEVEALGYALDLAYGDQEAYLSNGDPEQDYGDEWESVSQFKATQFEAIGALAGRMGMHGEVERWGNLARMARGEEVQSPPRLNCWRHSATYSATLRPDAHIAGAMSTRSRKTIARSAFNRYASNNSSPKRRAANHA